MAASEENSALFSIFVLKIIALPPVPYTFINLYVTFAKKTTNVGNCKCSVCFRSGKYRKSIFRRISNFSTYSNLTVLLLWVVVALLAVYIKHVNMSLQLHGFVAQILRYCFLKHVEVRIFEPFSILGLELQIQKLRKHIGDFPFNTILIKIQTQVEEAHKYFIDFISKAYQALTDRFT